MKKNQKIYIHEIKKKSSKQTFLPDFARSHTSFFFLTFLYFFLIFPADFNRVDSCSRKKKKSYRPRIVRKELK